MKKELKDIILVSVIAFIMLVGMIVSYNLIYGNFFDSGKSVTLKIGYLDKEYVYKNIKTTEENLYGFLITFDEKLALDIEITGIDNEAVIYSLKDTEVSPTKNAKYQISVNGEVQSINISGILIADGDEICIEYVSISPKDESVSLAEGGNGRLSYYDKVTITFYVVISVILAPVLAYIVVAIIKLNATKQIQLYKPKKEG